MKIRAYVSIGLIGCKRETDIDIPDEELDGLDGAEREDVIEEYIRDWAMERIEYGRLGDEE